MNVTAIASSSKGNAYVVEQDGKALLIDCGVSCKMLKAAVDLSRIGGILITHNHVDHVSGLKRLLNCINGKMVAYLSTMAMSAPAVYGELARLADEEIARINAIVSSRGKKDGRFE